jgi:hypothetical protein
VHFRRVILLFALVLGLTALVTSLGSPRRSGTTGGPDQAAERPAAPPVTDPLERTRELRFSDRGKARTRTVPPGAHLIVTVAAGEPAQAMIRGAGLVAPAGPRTPAVFDLLAGHPDRLEVIVAPVARRERRVGTILVGR